MAESTTLSDSPRSRSGAQDKEAVVAWFEASAPVFEPMEMTAAERTMFAMTAAQYIAARKAGALYRRGYLQAFSI